MADQHREDIQSDLVHSDEVDPDQAPPEEELPPPIPTGLELTTLDRYFCDSPYPIVEEMRVREPVHHDTVLNRYFLTRHDDVRDVLSDTALSNDPRDGSPDTFAHTQLRFDAHMGPSWSAMHDPEHLRLSEVVRQWLTPEAAEAFRPRITAVATGILDELDDSEFEIDLIARYASPITTLVLAQFFGIDPQHHPQFRRSVGVLMLAFVNPQASSEAAQTAAQRSVDECFRETIAARRLAPANDLISAMLGAAGDDTTVRMCNLVLITANIATAHLIGNGVRAMLQNTRQMTLLREKNVFVGQAIDEILRYDSPVVQTHRIARRDLVIAGCPIAKGETLTTSLAGANHDDSVYPESDRFDVSRADSHHHAFGGGAQRCPGAELATVTAQEAILGIVVRFEEFGLSPLGWEFALVPGLRIVKYFWVRT